MLACLKENPKDAERLFNLSFVCLIESGSCLRGKLSFVVWVRCSALLPILEEII